MVYLSLIAKIATKASKTTGGGVEVPQNPVMESPYMIELRHFVECVEKDKEPSVTGEDALRAIEMSLGTLKSIETGKPVEFPLI